MHSLCPGDREDKVELEEERRSIDVARLHKKIYQKLKNIKNIPLMYFFNLRENNVLQRERKYLFALSRSWATLWIFLWTGLVLVLTMVPYWKKQYINNKLLSFMLALSFPKDIDNNTTDMEFVKNFTLSDFQAKNFTLSISPNLNSFSKKKHKKWVKMEKFTPLAKILHCRRHWRHWQIPPLYQGKSWNRIYVITNISARFY